MSPAEVRQMADAVDGVSFSLLSRLRLGIYECDIAYKRLRSCANYLDKRKPAKAKAAA
jgi:hypothetical protein